MAKKESYSVPKVLEPALLGLVPVTIFAGLVIGIVSVDSNNWMVGDNLESIKVKMGLFQYCINSTCFDIGERSYSELKMNDVRTVRALMVLSLILDCFALLVMVNFCFNYKDIDSKWHAKFCTFLGLISALFAISGVAHFAVEVEMTIDVPEDLRYEFDYSLHLGWVSALVIIGSVILAWPVVTYFLNKIKEEWKGPEMPRYFEKPVSIEDITIQPTAPPIENQPAVLPVQIINGGPSPSAPPPFTYTPHQPLHPMNLPAYPAPFEFKQGSQSTDEKSHPNRETTRL